jgi:hypothetical protein
MRGLAEFVMRGRKQAIIAVLGLGLIPLLNFLSPIIVGLVFLRKGLHEASFVFAWAILPIGAWVVIGDPIPLFMLIGVSGLAVVLRSTESWEFTLLAAIAVGLGIEFYFRFETGNLDLVLQQVRVYIEANNIQGFVFEDLREFMISFIGAVYMFLAIVLLMASRWMQAVLFNPGGFQVEFHQLRIRQKVALGLLGLMFLANSGFLLLESWVMYFILPLVFSGVALVHAAVARKKLSTMWLAAFYALLVLPISLEVLVLLAIVDSWYNFRSRLSSSS